MVVTRVLLPRTFQFLKTYCKRILVPSETVSNVLDIGVLVRYERCQVFRDGVYCHVNNEPSKWRSQGRVAVDVLNCVANEGSCFVIVQKSLLVAHDMVDDMVFKIFCSNLLGQDVAFEQLQGLPEGSLFRIRSVSDEMCGLL